MQPGDSHSQPNRSDSGGDETKELLNLLRDLASGNIDEIECPSCLKNRMRAWFTNPADGEFRTWFVCSNCGVRKRVQNSGRPESYREDRRNTELETYDRDLLSKRRLNQ